MSDTDTSDQAFHDWFTQTVFRVLGYASMKRAWREADRRATAQVSEWMLENHWATGHGDDIPDLLKELNWQIEEMVKKAAAEKEEAVRRAHKAGWENRGAFEGFDPRPMDDDKYIDEYYRAYQAERAKEQQV